MKHCSNLSLSTFVAEVLDISVAESVLVGGALLGTPEAEPCCVDGISSCPRAAPCKIEKHG